MSSRIDAFIDRNGWQLLVFLVSSVVAFQVLKAQVANKAESSDLQRLERKLDEVLYLVCKQNATDSVCRK